MELIFIIGIVSTVFFSTNIDNLLCLVGFFSNREIKTKHIVLGWFAGSFLIIIASFLIAFLGSQFISPKFIGLFGLIPIMIGIKSLYTLKNSYRKNNDQIQKEKIVHEKSKSHIFTGAAVTIANGGDNLGAYTPLIVLQYQENKILITIFTFIFMTTVFCILSYFLVRKNKQIGKPFLLYGPIVLPFLLIFLGSSLVMQSFLK